MKDDHVFDIWNVRESEQWDTWKSERNIFVLFQSINGHCQDLSKFSPCKSKTSFNGCHSSAICKVCEASSVFFYISKPDSTFSTHYFDYSLPMFILGICLRWRYTFEVDSPDISSRLGDGLLTTQNTVHDNVAGDVIIIQFGVNSTICGQFYWLFSFWIEGHHFSLVGGYIYFFLLL